MPMAIPLLAAAGSVAAGVTAGGIIGGLMIAGGVLTGVGALTGNQTMMKWGGVLSLAGGVGSLANSLAGQTAQEVARQAAQETFRAGEIAAENAAGAAAPAVETAGSTAANAAVDAASANAAPTMEGPPMAGPEVAAPTGEPPGVVDRAMGRNPDLWEMNGPGEGGPPTPTDTPVKPLLQDTSPQVADPAAPTGSDPTLIDPSKTQPASATQTSPTSSTTKPAVDPGSTAGGGQKTWFDRASDWVRNNKEAAKIGADFVKGGVAAYGQEQALKTRYQLEEEARARERARYNAGIRTALTNPAPSYQPPKG